MAQITLNSGESFTVSGGTNTITGRTGSGEAITVTGGNQTFDADFNSGGDRIILSGTASQYSVSRSGSTVVFTGPNGTTVSFPAPNPNLTTAQLPVFQFSDQSLSLSSSTTGGFNVLLGTQTVTATPTGVGGGGTPVPGGTTVNVTATDVNEGGTILYTFTLSAASTSAITLNVATVGGTATASTDYTPVATTVTFAPGQTTAFLNVQTISDTTPNEAAETVVLQVSLPAGVTLAPTADLTAQINADPITQPQFILTTGNDTAIGTAAQDRIVGAQDTTQPGKLLSANDVVNGGEGTDTLELTNAPVNASPNVLADLDFTNVTSVETLVTNYVTVQLGAQADKAGIVTVDTATRTDSQNVGNVAPVVGTTLDLTSDANGDGVADFNNALNVTMANSAVDTVRLVLATAAGSQFNTGSTFTPTATQGNPNPVAFGAIDNVNLVGQVNPVRVTFTSTAVGNGSAFDAGSTTLAVALQSEDGNDGLTGGIVRFDDEGLRMAGGQFDVRDVSGTQRGTFGEVILGTSLADVFQTPVGQSAGIYASTPVAGSTLGSYINAGGGNDRVVGSTNADFLVGGAGDDVLLGGAGADSILGGAGNDIIIGGAGIDALLDGGEGSDTYVFEDGEFVANEAITDSGTGAGDVDYLAIRSVTAITDAQFAGRSGIEGLATDLTGVGSVTIGANAQALGVATVYASNDTLNAGAYTTGLTVYTQGSATTGSGADTVVLQNQTAQQARLTNTPDVAFTTSSALTQSYSGSLVLGGGDDTVVAGYALTNGAVAGTLTGGIGTDTLVLGGSVNGQGGVLPAGSNFTYTLNFGAGFTGFEAVRINNAGANAAVAYTMSFVDANVAPATTLTVDGTALRGTVAVGGGVNGTEILTVDASALTGTRAVNVLGGAAADVLTGGAGADTLNGGLGNDSLNGGAGNDVLLGGAGVDTLNGGAGTDTMDGGEDGDLYAFAQGEFEAGDVISDTGTAGTDIVAVNTTTAIVDASFANKTGLEELRILDNSGGAVTQTLGAAFNGTGITTIRVLNAGNDTVDATAATGNLLVFTGSGSVLTGSGNDEVRIAQGLNPATTTPDALFTAQNNSPISLGAGNDILRTYFNTSYTAAITGGAGSDTIVAGMGYSIHTSGTSTGNRGNANVAYTIALGAGVTGFEQLTLMGGDAAIDNATGADVAGNTIAYTVTVQNANVAVGTRFVVDATGLASNVVTTLGAGASVTGTGAVTSSDTVNFSAVLVDGNRSIEFRGSANNDVVVGSAGNDLLNGGAGNDTLRGGAGNDVINGGEGDDIIQVTTAEFGNDNDQVDGGAGTDTLQITGGGDVGDFGFSGRYTSIEALQLSDGAYNFTAGQFAQQAGILTYSFGPNVTAGSTLSLANLGAGATLNDINQVTDNSVVLVGSAFADVINIGVTNTAIGGGDDTVRAGAGNDVINAGSELTAADLINGGAGIDTLNVSGDGTAGAQTRTITVAAAGGGAAGGAAATSGIFSIENLVLASGLAGTAGAVGGAAGTAGTATSYNVTVADNSFDGATANLNVDGGALRLVSTGAGADGVFGTTDDVFSPEVLNFSAAGVTGAGHTVTVTGGAGNDIITGGAGNDTLTAGAGNDTVNGGDGNDLINGGAGDDTLNGGAGNDIITGGSGADTINGGTGIDTINLGGDDARDTVIVGTAEAQRAAQAGIETVNGFVTAATIAGPDGIFGNADDVAYAATADVIDFGAGVINTTSTSITNGVVQTGTVLANAINSSTSLLAAIQLVEQEFQAGSDPAANNGVVAFTYQGNTYIGEITGAQGAEAFIDIVQVTGVSGVTGLVDVDGAGAGTALGLYI